MRNLSIVVASLVIVFLGQKSRDHSARVNVSGYSTLSPWETGDLFV
jgi:hypothetical protein